MDLWLVWVVFTCQAAKSASLADSHYQAHLFFLMLSQHQCLTSTVGCPFVPVLVEVWNTSLFSGPTGACEALGRGSMPGPKAQGGGSGPDVALSLAVICTVTAAT